ncbi:hypothetical protein ACJX0J_012578, partial [Zea mays]
TDCDYLPILKKAYKPKAAMHKIEQKMQEIYIVRFEYIMRKKPKESNYILETPKIYLKAKIDTKQSKII